MNTETRERQVLDQQLALSAYLDALLDEAPVAPVEAAVVERAVAPEPPMTETDGAPAAPPGETAVVAAPPVPGGLPAAGVPEWAESRFQALLFEVAGLKLAVPLTKLKGVIPNTHGVTPMPGHSDLFLGVTPYQGQQTRVIDTARFVLPEKLGAQLSEQPDERAAHLVVIDEGRWALACCRIGEVIELDADRVKWRTASGKRLWLAGTVIDRMCALLDVDQLAASLVDSMA